MKQYIVAKEGWIFLFFLLIITLVVYTLADWWCLLPGILFFFVVYFFRNPKRSVPDDNGVIVAPADGVVKQVEIVTESRFLNEEAIKVSIFLSLFNVHINRAPVEGTVEYVEKVGGRFIPAYRKEASDLNARNFVGLATRWGKILVVQITGLIARRIVCWSSVGDMVETGERFGLIRFGSCTELYLPRNVEVMIKPGDRVKGGLSVLGRFTD
ncbi:MAG: phosphatidylserine decarboxylase family protein [Chitinophagales bacterium]